MRVVSATELGYMPNGTVFTRIIDPLIKKGIGGDLDVSGLMIMCGHDQEWNPQESGKFNGILYMNYSAPVAYSNDGTPVVNDISLANGDYDMKYVTDTANCDVDNDWYFLIYDKNEVRQMIRNLQWALKGCKDE